MKRTKLPIKLQRLVANVPYVTIATTCPAGNPWNTPVSGYFDDDMNLYWASWTQNQHSRNIAHDSRIFAVLFDTEASEGDGIGLYMEMEAHVIKEPEEVLRARQVYTTTFGESLAHEPFIGTCPRRIYKAAPIKIWWNTDGHIKGNFVDRRAQLFPA